MLAALADDEGCRCSESSGENMLVSPETSFVYRKGKQSPLGIF